MSLTTRRVAELSCDRIDDLPERCRTCLFWELGAPRALAVGIAGAAVDAEDEMAADPGVQKSAWWRDVELESGPAGRVVRVDGEPVGYALFAPAPAFARRRSPIPSASDDALLLATVWVDPAHRGAGSGRLLVQAAVKEALRLDLHAVEAYGDRRHREGQCVAAATWLLHEGFAVHREHPRYPLLRLDVRTTVRWTEPIEHAVETALGRLGRRPAPGTVRTAGGGRGGS